MTEFEPDFVRLNPEEVIKDAEELIRAHKTSRKHPFLRKIRALYGRALEMGWEQPRPAALAEAVKDVFLAPIAGTRELRNRGFDKEANIGSFAAQSLPLLAGMAFWDKGPMSVSFAILYTWVWVGAIIDLTRYRLP